jgi:hypothetical protein
MLVGLQNEPNSIELPDKHGTRRGVRLRERKLRGARTSRNASLRKTVRSEVRSQPALRFERPRNSDRRKKSTIRGEIPAAI